MKQFRRQEKLKDKKEMLKDKNSKKEGVSSLKLAVPLRWLAGKIIKITKTILTILLSNNGNNEA